jgi:hypothetical protein
MPSEGRGQRKQARYPLWHYSFGGTAFVLAAIGMGVGLLLNAISLSNGTSVGAGWDWLLGWSIVAGLLAFIGVRWLIVAFGRPSVEAGTRDLF